MPRPVAVSVDFTLPLPPHDAYVLTTQVELADAFHAAAGVPAVTGTTPLEGAWDHAGARRLVHVDGGGQLTEEVLVADPPIRFEYRISDFTFALRHLIDEGRGQFRFGLAGPHTAVTWKYTFTPRSQLTTPVVALFARLAWRRYMAATARRFGDLSRRGEPSPP